MLTKSNGLEPQFGLLLLDAADLPSAGFPSEVGGFPAGFGGFPAGVGGFPASGAGFPAAGAGFPAEVGGFPAGVEGLPLDGLLLNWFCFWSLSPRAFMRETPGALSST